MGWRMRLLISVMAFGALGATATAEVDLWEGELDGAPYTVAAPAGWDGGKAFFHVHGWRPAHAPHLADLDLDNRFYQNLLDAGWLIGRTAFQENGVDHDAHTVALRNLRTWIERERGAIDILVLEGESTAGTLVLRIAEQDHDLADGVIALGPFIDLEDAARSSFLTAAPKLPAILMTNITEIGDDAAYVAVATDRGFSPSLRPLLLPGHVNVNWVERWEALLDLEAAIDGKRLPTVTTGSRGVPARETGTITAADQLTNRVTAVNVFYGNAFLGFHPEELTAAGITQGESYLVMAGDTAWPVFYGTSYGDVPLGEWVMFPTADEEIMLVRNHQSAIETADLEVGDTVGIRIERRDPASAEN